MRSFSLQEENTAGQWKQINSLTDKNQQQPISHIRYDYDNIITDLRILLKYSMNRWIPCFTRRYRRGPNWEQPPWHSYISTQSNFFFRKTCLGLEVLNMINGFKNKKSPGNNNVICVKIFFKKIGLSSQRYWNF